MSHEVESLAYVGAVPWHGLGEDVTGMDHTPAEMAKAAGVDWRVEKNPIYQRVVRADGSEVFSKIPRTYTLSRSSDSRSLSIVGEMYHPIQNLEAIDFLTKFVSAGHMKMNTVGSLRGGRQIWALASIDRDFDLPGNDAVKGYVLISVPHMLGHGITIKHTSVRVVCMNTITQALRDSGSSFRMPHVRAFDDGMRSIAEHTLGLSKDRSDAFEAQARLLASKAADPAQVKEFVMRVFDRKTKPGDKIENSTRPARIAYSAIDSQPGAHMKSSEGTWWGALNAVTYTVDYLLGRDRDTALTSAWFGGRANTKTAALRLATQYAEAA